MKILNKIDILFISLILIFIIVMIKLNLNAYLSFLFLVFIYILHIGIIPNRISIYPFLFYPLMFIIKAPDQSNLLLISMPEIFTLMAIIFLYIKNRSINLNFRISILYYLIIIHIFLSFIIPFFHVFNISFILLIFRQYTLPLLFLITIVLHASNDNIFIKRALLITIISFSFVAFLAILNLFNIINFHSELPELQPILTIQKDTNAIQIERESIFLVTIPRLNLLTGGALGSSAAIFILLSIIIFFIDKIIIRNYILRFFVFLTLTLSAFLTASSSITIPLLVLFFLHYFYKYKFVNKVFLLIIGFILLFVSLFVFSFNPFLYFQDSILKSLIGYFENLNFQDFLFGIGPRITTSGFNFINENKFFIIDVGMLRVFVESGIFNFLIFSSIIFRILKRGISNLKSNFSIDNLKYFLIFTTMCLLVHANFSLLPPFYPLFTIGVSGIIINYKNTKTNIIYAQK